MKKNIKDLIKNIDDIIFDNIGPIRLLFVITNILSYQTFLPLIRRVIKDKTFKASLTLENKGCFVFPEDDESQFLMKNYYEDTSKALICKWHYIFKSDLSSLYFLRHATSVSVGHGFGHGGSDASENSGIKTANYAMKMAMAKDISLVFMTAKSLLDLPTESCDQKILDKHREWLLTGAIKSDEIIGTSFSHAKRQEVCDKFNIDPKMKNVIIFSHWTKKSLLNNISTSDVENLCVMFPGLNFIIQGHPLLWINHDGTDAKNPLYLELQDLDKQYINFRFTPLLNQTVEITKIADYFIGDNSSYFIEACLADKPIIFYDHSDFVFLSPLVGSLYKEASKCFSSPDELIKALSEITASADLKKDKRKTVVDYFLFKPGNSVNYIIRSLKIMGRVSGPGSRSWHRVIRYCKKEREENNLFI